MTDAVALERISEIQEEILRFTWDQVADRVDTFYVQGKVSDDESGQVLMLQGNFVCGTRGSELIDNGDALDDEEFDSNSGFICPRIHELHDLLFALQGKSPVRFRWVVDTRPGRVESDWTYYDDLTDTGKRDDSWKHWEGDSAWMDEIQAHLTAAQSGSAPVRGQDTP